MSAMLEETLSFGINQNTPPIRFLASLSDGRTVIQDNKPGEPAAWKRLAKFILANPEIKITCVRLQGPNGKDIAMPSGQKGYFFGNKYQKVFPGGQALYVGIGFYDGNKIAVQWHKVPLFDQSHSEERPREKGGFSLIENVDV
jgi:hypothetical protein